jgi:glutamate racemase
VKIGIFDSGLGGLIITKAIMEKMPEYDYVYFGDTLNLPYGGKSKNVVYNLSFKVIHYLFQEQDCNLIIIACNTASVCALRQLQQQYLVENFPNRRILGVVIPTIETIAERSDDKIGILATQTTVKSGVYEEEIKKVINKPIQIISKAAPLLVPMIEYNGIQWIKPILEYYLEPFVEANVQSILLGCTHYPRLKNIIRKILPNSINIISQDEIIPKKLLDYLSRHPEIEKKLKKGGERKFIVSDITENYIENARRLYNKDIDLVKVEL